MARGADPLVAGGLVALVAAATWFVPGAAEERPPADPAPPVVLAAPTDAAELRRFVAGCEAADANALPRLRELVASPDPVVAGNAVRALGRLQPDGSEATFAALLHDPRPRVRAEAIAALGAGGDPGAARLLEPLVRVDDRQVRLLAIQALAQLGATDALQRVAADPGAAAETRAFARAASRPVRVPRLLASTVGGEAR
ncbi:MAG: HEAT repeat domain-containing protein [Planctomycetota bacterium]